MTWRMKLGQETGYNVVPQVRSFVKPDTWNHGEFLTDGSDWDKCQFRLPTKAYELAVNVEVTGRTLQCPFGRWGADYVRVKITFVADKAVDWYTGEMVGEDVETRGWMLVTDREKEWVA